MVIMFSLLLLNVSNTFAQQDDSSDSISWQLVMISSEPACSNYHYQMMNLYSEITEKYLDMYNVDSVKYYQECLSEEEYNSEYQAPLNAGLVVLVYDRNLGEAELHSQDMGGFYSHMGDDRSKNNLIVFCDCSNFYYSNPVWILTHELSHFVLYYQGFGQEQIEIIHDIDKRYDYCEEVQYDEYCKTLSAKLNTNSYNWSVMPLYEQALQIKLTTDQSIYLDSRISQPSAKSLIDSDLHRMIIKWWQNGKISESDYILAMKSLYGQNYSLEMKQKEKLEIENNLIIFADSLKLVDELEVNEQITQWPKDKLQELLKRSPFVTDQNISQNNEDGSITPFASADVNSIVILIYNKSYSIIIH